MKHERMPTHCVPNARRHCETEQRNLSQEIIRWTQKEVFAITRKTLADLAATSLEERMSEVFVGRLRALNGAAKEQLAAALKTSDPPGDSCAAQFDLPPAQRDAIESAVKDTFAADSSSPVRDRAGAGQRHRTLRQRTEGGLEHRGLSRDAGKDCRRTSARGCQARIQTGKAKPTSDAKPEPKAEAKPGPKREPKHGLEPVPSAPKADH